ncbi:hypothetical protein N7462_004039 [Penicillium macrosclerotiorum]|uniref:uncharacterized protein n=1 Tax=Penicillium macrosclerotiorum TaxID=303699 RepID=UPI0025477CCB|nr:uncharacterized protein N7462_004039 [Penicillium macrosclerotiorum]KAJ5689647.1 hypothetical protein N7462_004039 [Penicillium macrosclerotiorum]
MSPHSSSLSAAPPTPKISNNDSQITGHDDHPDAPLPAGPYCYRDDPDAEPDSERDDLTPYEPRPIEDDGAALEASRPRSAWRAQARVFWLRNKGMFLVLLAQMFGASMNVMTQVLEIHSSMHPFQILFARMSITAVASYLYMWYARVPAPFGTRPVIWLLLIRATCGFMGVYGLYYSVQYLELSEATVITFLAPILTCYACSLLIPGETFSRRQQLAALVSLAGVVLIARPFSTRAPRNSSPGSGPGAGDSAGTGDESPDAADSYHHLLATVVAFVGVLGAAGAYTSIRMIGRRAHPLVSVTYFSSVTTVISFVAMLLPWIPFRLPATGLEWTLLTGLGVCGFLLQFLLTAGLSYVPPAWVGSVKAGQGSRATSMVYTQMLFALFYDKVVWGSTLSPVSWAGSGLILACAVYVALVQEGRSEPKVVGAEEDHPRFKDGNDEEAATPAARG